MNQNTKPYKTYNQDEIRRVIVNTTPVEDSKPIDRLDDIKLPNFADTPVVTEKPQNFDSRVLHDAVLYAQDKLERSMMSFILLGDTAQAMYEGKVGLLESDKIEIGVLKPVLTADCLSMLKSLVDPEIVKNEEGNIIKMVFHYKEVPIEIKVIQNKYPFFDRPNGRFYYITEFKYANPFEDYWLVKDDIE